MAKSLAEHIAMLSEDEREAMLSDLDPDTLQWDWRFWGRPEQLAPETDDWSVFLALAGRGFGKQLEDSTKIPTPSGWTTIGQIQVGDFVFDEAGLPTRVLAVYKPKTERMYRLTFSDGTTVVAGGDHQWTTWDYSALKSYTRKGDRVKEIEHLDGFPTRWHDWTRTDRWGAPTGTGPKVRTTDEIVATFRHGARGDLNHFIPVCRPLQYPRQLDLPIDPYVYGAWLGDGFSNGYGICAGRDDWEETLTLLREAGANVTNIRHTKPGDTDVRVFTLSGMKKVLQQNGMLTKDSVDRRYLEGDVDQRLEFLAGLLDTDGHQNPVNGTIEFSSTKECISRAVYELFASFGEKPKIVKGVAKLYGVEKQPRWRVTVRARQNYFKLPRKAADFLPTGAQNLRNHHRTIKKFEQVPVVPSTCITVDSPSSLFLATEACIPTHNTRASAEWVREKAKITNQGPLRIGLVARTASDVRDVIVQGESGILAVSPPSERPEYQPSLRKLTWPNGNTALCYTSEEPSTLRGPQFHYAFADEFAAWRQIPDEVGMTAWANLRIATRLGKNPQIFVATTPKRVQSLKDLLKEADGKPDKIIIRKGSTMDNASNLAEAYMEGILGVYDGTKLGRQELYGEMLDDIEGALFSMKTIGDFRANVIPIGTPLRIVGVDPTVAEKPGDECGIVVMSSTAERDLYKRQAWVLEDASIHGAPDVWAKRVVETAKKWGAPVVAERNQGGALIRNAIQAIDPSVPVFEVWSKQGKALRAEPIALIYEQGRVHHLGYFAELEDQMTTWEPEAAKKTKSPDRLDALVLAATALMVLPPKGFGGGMLTAHRGAAQRKLPSSRPSGGRGSGQGRRSAVYGVNLKRR